MSQMLIDAGAILPGQAKADSGHDTMTARHYRHPVLGQTVVRLVGSTVGPAEDLSMEFLGFETAGPPAVVGHARRQALGFPAWALVNDPANGRHALALVKDMERLARMAKSKPGNAKDGYDTLAARLGQAAPQFLPTFWEQAGRAFIAAENPRMAGTCFTLARTADQVHGLPIDEERLREVHLEFAFAGALTAKMLTEFARGVVDRQPAEAAYRLVRTLALRRVAGGLPPQVSMPADLAKLAKAAGLDPEAEAETVISQLMSFPAMTRAPMTVWKGYRKALIKLSKNDTAVRARLLEIMPEPPGYDADGTEEWLEILAATGADKDLVAKKPGALSAGRWLERLMALRQRRRKHRSERLLSLVDKMAPRLIAEAKPLEMWSGYSWRAELDVLDLCVAKGIPLQIGNGSNGFDLIGWSVDGEPGARDLTALAANESLRELLKKGVRAAISRLRVGTSLSSPALPAETISQTFAAAGVTDVFRELLGELTGQAMQGTVLSLDEALTELAASWSPAGVALAPQAFQSLQEVDVAAMLGLTLRSGLMEEYSWPQYEQAAKNKLNTQTGTSWPSLVVHDNRSAQVINPDGSVIEHAFSYPAAGSDLARHSYSQTYCHYVDNDMLVRWSAVGKMAGYWLSDPADVFESSYALIQQTWGARSPLLLPVPGGGATCGARPWHTGDTATPQESYPVATDGSAFWRCEHEQATPGQLTWHWREFDPKTGTPGRNSLPEFFARPLPDGATLITQMCELRQAPEGFSRSPLGWHRGAVGWRVAVMPDGSQAGEGIDGRTVTWKPPSVHSGPLGQGPFLLGAVAMPGDSAVRPLTAVRQYRGSQHLTVWTADGRYPVQRYGDSVILPPMEWWHALTPRDPDGSAALRHVSNELAARLLDVGASPQPGTELAEAVAGKLAALLPQITDGMLQSVVATVISRAIVLRRRLDEVEVLLQAGENQEPQTEVVLDEALRKAWSGLVGRNNHFYYYGGTQQARQEMLQQVRSIGALLSGKPADAPPATTPSWAELLPGPGAISLRAASPICEADDRVALSGLLTAFATSGLADLTPLRIVSLAVTEQPDGVQVLRAGNQLTILIAGEKHWHNSLERWLVTGFQFAPDGNFTAPPAMTVQDEVTCADGWSGSQRIESFVSLLNSRGPATWQPSKVDELVALTGMTRPQAVLLLAGLPGLDSWEANFLSAPQRAILGINTTQARIARDALRELSTSDRVALLDAAMPQDPVSLWDNGPDVTRLAQRWIELCGARVAVPDQLITDAGRILPKQHVADVIQMIAQPQPRSWLTTDGKSTSVGWNDLRTTAADNTSTPFDTNYLYSAAVALAWLAYQLPWGDPIRAALPAALDLTRQRLRNPDLLLGHQWWAQTDLPKAGPALVSGAAAHGGMHLHIVPSKLTGPDDPALGFTDPSTGFALRLLLSDHLTAAVTTPLGGHGDPRDPSICVPDLLDEVCKHTGLDRDPAAYYLQLLALPDPTDRNVLVWNGWKTATLKHAQAALTAAGLVLAAKRERAGRPVFLPGGWQTAKAPSLPLETWKTSLYHVHGSLTLVTEPVPQLFGVAWQRITSGDTPRYLDFKETR